MTITFRFDRWFTKDCEYMLAKNNITNYEFDGIYCVLNTNDKSFTNVLSSLNYVEFIFAD